MKESNFLKSFEEHKGAPYKITMPDVLEAYEMVEPWWVQETSPERARKKPE